jgi:hypothetical protein
VSERSEPTVEQDGDRGKSPLMVAVAALALLLFNFPLLAVFDVGVSVLGVPLLWAYLFTSWAVVIAVVSWVVRDS